MTMRVGVVDDHPLVRAGLSFALQREGVDMVFQAGTVATAVAAVREHRPDVVVLDVLLPDGTGIDVCRAVAGSGAPIWVVLTTFDDAVVVEAAARVGVRGVFSKECEPRQLFLAMKRLMEDRAATAFPERRWPALTDRERSVLVCLVSGASFPDTGRQLGIAESTVKDYAARLYGKFAVADRAELMMRLGPLAHRLIGFV